MSLPPSPLSSGPANSNLASSKRSFKSWAKQRFSLKKSVPVDSPAPRRLLAPPSVYNDRRMTWPLPEQQLPVTATPLANSDTDRTNVSDLLFRWKLFGKKRTQSLGRKTRARTMMVEASDSEEDDDEDSDDSSEAEDILPPIHPFYRRPASSTGAFNEAVFIEKVHRISMFKLHNQMRPLRELLLVHLTMVKCHTTTPTALQRAASTTNLVPMPVPQMLPQLTISLPQVDFESDMLWSEATRRVEQQLGDEWEVSSEATLCPGDDEEEDVPLGLLLKKPLRKEMDMDRRLDNLQTELLSIFCF